MYISLTFTALSKANNVSNTERQTYSYNKEKISLKPYQRKDSKNDPSNSLHRKMEKTEVQIAIVSKQESQFSS